MHALRAAVVSAILAVATLSHPAAAQAPKGPGIWQHKAPMLMTRSETAMAALDGKLYVVGGSAPGRSVLSTTEEYDPATESWRVRAPLPRELSHIGLAATGGLLYVVGGFSAPDADHTGAVDTAFVYDPKRDAWQTIAPMKAPRGSVGLSVLDGKLHAIGGRGLDKLPVATHEIYDPATNSWHDAAPLGLARDHLAVVVADGVLHVIGGRTTTLFDNLALHETWDAANDRWQSAPPLPTPRSSGAATVSQGMILVAGGECRTNTTYAENEGYDLKTGAWQFLSPLPGGRHAFAAATVGAVAYFAGGALGCGGTGTTNDLLAFTLPDRK